MFKSKKQKFKEKTLNKLQEKIWIMEMSITAHEEFQAGAAIKESKFKNQVQELEGLIAGVKDSTTHEDRQKMTVWEEELKTAKGNTEKQVAEIDKSKQIISKQIRLIEDIKEEMDIIKKRF